MRRLVFQQTYLTRRDLGALARVSRELVRKRNPPNVDYLIIDNASPFPIEDFLDGPWEYTTLEDAKDTPTLKGSLNVVRFKDSLGHPFKEGGRACVNGPGRGMAKGVEIAIANGYQQVAHVEADVLAALPIPEVDTVACLRPSVFGWYDWSVFVMSVPWAKGANWLGNYDWWSPRDWGTYVDEDHMSAIAGTDLQVLPWRGERNEWRAGPLELRERYPDGIDWLTHALPETMREFLKMNGEHVLASDLEGV